MSECVCCFMPSTQTWYWALLEELSKHWNELTVQFASSRKYRIINQTSLPDRSVIPCSTINNSLYPITLFGTAVKVMGLGARCIRGVAGQRFQTPSTSHVTCLMGLWTHVARLHGVKEKQGKLVCANGITKRPPREASNANLVFYAF